MATVYKLIGKGTTSNGVAHMTQKTTDNGSTWTDVNGLVGEGKGRRNILASTDATITESSLQSITYEVLDCLKYDSGTGENSIWTLGNNNNASLTTGSDYRILSEITLGTDAWVYLKIDHQCILEFDVKLTSTNYGAKFFQFGQSANAGTRGEDGLLQPLQNGDWHHIKLTFDNGVASMSSPETTTTKSININNYDASVDMYFRFRTLSDVTKISFKEFKYYPI